MGDPGLPGHVPLEVPQGRHARSACRHHDSSLCRVRGCSSHESGQHQQVFLSDRCVWRPGRASCQCCRGRSARLPVAGMAAKRGGKTGADRQLGPDLVRIQIDRMARPPAVGADVHGMRGCLRSFTGYRATRARQHFARFVLLRRCLYGGPRPTLRERQPVFWIPAAMPLTVATNA